MSAASRMRWRRRDSGRRGLRAGSGRRRFVGCWRAGFGRLRYLICATGLIDVTGLVAVMILR